MTSVENSSPSTPSQPSLERSDSSKKDKKSKDKSLLAASRVLGERTEEKTAPEKSAFKLFDSEEPVKKESDEFADEVEADKANESSEAFETFSEDEELEAAQIIVADEIENSPTEEENSGVNSYRTKVVEGMAPQAALSEVLEENGIDPDAIYEEAEDAPINLDPSEIDLLTVGEEGELPLKAISLHNTLQDELEDTPDTNTSSSGHGGGGSNQPPTSFASGGGNPHRPNPWRSSRMNPNAFPSAGLASSESYSKIRQDHREYWSNFMDGSIVGYFIGHRRGRIKTEKKLNSVKKSLEKQVKKIDKEIKSHERIIRQVVKDKADTRVTKPKSMRTELTRELAARPKAIKKEVASPIPAAEIHIGKLVMSEKPREVSARPNRVEAKPRASEPQLEKAIRPETMSHHELLKHSEDIMIDGSSLREIYESQLVGEKGLRRLVSEHERGGDLREALRLEVTERQIDFERDPAMRDVASSGSPSVSGTGQLALEQMIKKAESALSNSQEEVSFLKAKAAYEDKQKFKQGMQSRAINAVFLSVIAILVIVIILLSFLRHG